MINSPPPRRLYILCIMMALTLLSGNVHAKLNYQLLRDGTAIIDDFYDVNSPHYFGRTLKRLMNESSLKRLMEYCDHGTDADQQQCLNQEIVKRVTSPLEHRLAQMAQRYPSIAQTLKPNTQFNQFGGQSIVRGATSGLLASTGIYAAVIYCTTPVAASLWAAVTAWWYGTTAVGTLGAAMLAGPIGWAIGAGSLIMAGGAYWYYQSDHEEEISRFHEQFRYRLRNAKVELKNKWRQFVAQIPAHSGGQR